MPKSEPLAVRLHPELRRLIDRKAKELKVTISWIVEIALAEQFAEELPPSYRPGMPHRPPKKGKK
jgi:predicted transcriptional regulator